ncbi:MAG: hypothetical protein AB8B87_16935 [Granulosicoccus sp.]
MYSRGASRALEFKAELDALTTQSLQQRLSSAFPEADDLLVIVSSPDAEALGNACVITKPEQAIDC